MNIRTVVLVKFVTNIFILFQFYLPIQFKIYAFLECFCFFDQCLRHSEIKNTYANALFNIFYQLILEVALLAVATCYLAERAVECWAKPFPFTA